MNTNDTASHKSEAHALNKNRQRGSSAILAPTKPETFRLPSGRERDPYFGIGRSYWNSLVLATPANGFRPKVKSYVIRRRGSRTGLRLIDFDSAFAFIQQHQEKSDMPTPSVAQRRETAENPACEAPTTAEQHQLGGRS
jgi:hypothetical protein